MRKIMGLFFGDPDAWVENAERFRKYYYKRPSIVDLKLDELKEGYCITVGPKGTGKSAICRAISERKKDLIWHLSASDGFTLDGTSKYRASFIKEVIEYHLLAHLIEMVSDDNEISQEARNKIPIKYKKYVKYFTKLIPKLSGEISAGPVKLTIEPKELLKLDNADLATVKVEYFREILADCLIEKKAYILLDDIDEVFPGIEKNVEFFEGLLAAAVEINYTFEDLLHLHLFVKTGIYAYYNSNGRNPDKYKGKFFFLRWTDDELAEVLAIRSKIANDITEDLSVEDSLLLSFSHKSSNLAAIRDFIVQRVNSGPRDMIILCNEAKDRAHDSKISLTDLKNAESSYSQTKIDLLNSNYKDDFGEVAEIIKLAFTGSQSKFKKGELIEFINTRILGNSKLMSQFGKEPLLIGRDEKFILEKLYQFGFIGAKINPRVKTNYYSSSEGQGILSTSDLINASEHSIHLAYHSALQIK